MKRMFVAVLLVLSIASFTGCERNRVSRETNQLTAAFEYTMDKGSTTRDQEQRFIRAVSKATLQLDSANRGTKKAQKSRDDALKLMSGPVDLGGTPRDIPQEK